MTTARPDVAQADSEEQAAELAHLRLPLGKKVVLASGDYGFNLVLHSIELYLLFYYTEFLGLSPIFAATVVALGSVCDAVVDPIVGALADRTRTRWGRFRPWVVLVSPLIALALAATFYRPAILGAQLATYALMSHLFLRAMFTSASIPYIALSARVTRDSRDRSTIAGLRMQFAGFASLTVAMGYPFMVDLFGDRSDSKGYFYAAILLGILVVPILVNSMARITEPPEEVAAPGPRRSVAARIAEDGRAFVAMTTRNGAFLRVLLAIILVSTAGTMISKTTLYYFKYVVGLPDLGRFGLASSALSLCVVAPLWALIANRTSKRTTWMMASAFAATGLALLYVVPPIHPWIAFGLLFVIGIGTTGQAVMFWSMLPDAVEANELLFGDRYEAKTLGFGMFARKLTLATNAFAIGAVLSAVGFVSNAAPTPGTIAGLKALIALVPLTCVLLSVAVIWGYRLSAGEHATMKARIAARR